MALSLAPADHGPTGPAQSTIPSSEPTVLDPVAPLDPDPDPGSGPPAGHRGGGWRSRLVATVAYLLTLAGLLAVAVTGTDGGMPGPISRSDGDRVVASGLVGVVEQVLEATQGTGGP